MIFQEKLLILYSITGLYDQISLVGCFYFVRSWAMCLLQLFVNQIATSYI